MLAFLGEYMRNLGISHVRAIVIIGVLGEAGISAPAVRACLDRMAASELVRRERVGREIEVHLTERARRVLDEGSRRVHERNPFVPRGDGWTLVSFSLSEDQRAVRHRLRAALGWEGFAPLRDGLWVAPGEVELSSVLQSLPPDLPSAAIIAFRAQELPEFPIADALGNVWNLDDIRAEHELFLATWGEAGSWDGITNPLAAHVALVADWLALLRADPRLPGSVLGAGWPAGESLHAFHARGAEMGDAAAEFRLLTQQSVAQRTRQPGARKGAAPAA
ncbi:PaaX family transcriptional regulator C-terminal domain-containing protein [Microbacter sp. GSS18]|nr:PaaX family transcriptional regulator C-terminal domain-containing protein [Microbacter sp. GSS18]